MLMQSWLRGVRSCLFGSRRMRRGAKRQRPVSSTATSAERVEIRQYPAATMTATLTAGVLNIEGTTKADAITVQQTGDQLAVRNGAAVLQVKVGAAGVNQVAASQVQLITINSLGGDDTIRLDGVSIAANINGGDGGDNITGGNGNDTLTGGLGNDILNGGGGVDTLFESGNVNFVLTNAQLTGNGTDKLTSIELARLTGGAGNNSLNASAFSGSVTLDGVGGNDTLTGGNASDSLIGGLGDDKLIGNGGNDVLEGGAGNDNLNGGEGDDRFVFSGSAALGADVIVAGDSAGTNTLDFSAMGVGITRLDLSLTAVQTLNLMLKLTLNNAQAIDNVVGTNLDDVIQGNDLDNTLEGRGGSDTLEGRKGNDILDGGTQRDFLIGSEGQDQIVGGEGSDVIYFDPQDAIHGDASDEVLSPNMPNGQSVMVTFNARGIVNPLPTDNNIYNSTAVRSVGLAQIPGWRGSGTLIGSRYVLTAAHVVLDPFVPQAPQPVTFAINGAIYIGTRNFIHPNYDRTPVPPGATPAVRPNDIAIVELDRDVTTATPVSIARFVPRIGDNLLLVGFGNTGRTGDSGTTPNIDRLAAFTPLDDAVNPTTIHWRTNSTSEGNTAGGDSGGGNFIQRNGQWFVAGVTSGGTPSTQVGARSVSTRVDAYVPWIDSIVNQGFTLPVGMSGDTLFIRGGDGRDVINLNGRDGNVTVSAPGFRSESFAGVRRVRFDGNDGNDELNVAAGFNIAIEAFGGLGDDVLNGGMGNDTLGGNEGHDQLNGQDGDDLLSGDDGDDKLTGGVGNDLINGGSGEDFADGGSGSDTLNGDGDRDRLVGGDDDDVLNGDFGDDLLQGGAGNDQLNGGIGADNLDGGSGNDFLRGNEGADILEGGDGQDTLFGGEDRDQLRGGAGNDLLNGDAGADEVDGGAGDDALVIDLPTNANGIVDMLVGGTGRDTLSITPRYDDTNNTNAGNSLVSGDNWIQVVWAGATNPRRFTAQERDFVTGNVIAATTFTLSGGNDTDIETLTINGLDGDDRIEVATEMTRNVILDGGAGDDTLIGGGGQNVLLGDTGDDSLVGNANDDELHGGDGNDTLRGLAGSDRLYGDKGNDDLDGGAGSDFQFGGDDIDKIFAGSGQLGDVIYGGEGNDELLGGDGIDIIHGDGGNDTIHGGALGDVIEGDEGNDDLWGDRGLDVMHGGRGNDTLHATDGLAETVPTLDDIQFALNQVNAVVTHTKERVAAINVDLHDGQTTPREQADLEAELATLGNNVQVAGLMLTEIGSWLGGTIVTELLDGGEDNDELFGSQFADKLFGNEGNDLFHHSAGRDTVVGGGGDADAYLLDGTERDDEISISSFEIHAGNLSFVVTVRTNGVTTSSDPINLSPDLKAIGVRGLGGNDTMTVYLGQNALKDVRFDGGEGNDTLDVRNSVSRVTLVGGAGNDTLYGGLSDDSLDGGSGEDSLSGGDGQDSINGGTGNDELHGGDGKDTIEGGEGNDSIYGEGNDDNLQGGSDNDTIDGGSGNDSIEGGNDRDSILGGIGDDTIDGGGDDDTIYGEAGNDRLLGKSGADNLNGQNGSDTIVGGTGGDRISGGTEDDVLIGEEGNDTIWGNEGDDFIHGGEENDDINAGSGNDYVLGGPGNDEIEAGSGNDEVHGNQGHDRIAGNEGSDGLYGDEGDDTLDGTGDSGSERDTLNGGSGTDKATYQYYDQFVDVEDARRG